jgi:hypothetical protein
MLELYAEPQPLQTTWQPRSDGRGHEPVTVDPEDTPEAVVPDIEWSVA